MNCVSDNQQLTDEEFFRLNKERRIPKINKSNIPEYDQVDIENDIYPRFIKSILEDTCLQEYTKQQFVDNFLKTYISDYTFRKKVSGDYIVFLNDDYYGILKNGGDIFNIGNIYDRRYLFQIGNKK